METWAVLGFVFAGLWTLYMTVQWLRYHKREHSFRSICERLSENLERVILFYDGRTQNMKMIVGNCEAVFGVSKEEWLRRPETLIKYLCQQMAPELISKMNQGQIQGTVNYEFCNSAHQTAEEQWYQLKIISIGRDGEAQYFLFIDNSTEQKQVQGTLKMAMLDAEQANRAKTFFLSRMSHEIRTPLNAIIGMQTIAQNNLQDPKKVGDCLKKISVASQHLLELINDILEISRIESGKVELSREQFKLPELIQSVYDMVQLRAAKKKQLLLLNMDGLREGILIGDSMRMRQVLLNIMTNAVKYTEEEGRISLSASQTNSRRSGYSHIVITVSDNGIGMSEDFLHKLFEPFEMEGQSSAAEGTGLGMAITRNIVNMMGGSISVSSQKGQGTAITVELDLEQLEKSGYIEAPLTQKLTPSMEKVFYGKRILLAEDNELNAEITIELLTKLGAEVSRVKDGELAVQSYRYSASGTFDLILMDIQMPGMDGYRAAKAIRSCKNQDAATIPIIALTADAFTEDIKKARAAGMNDHVSKPIDMKRLAEVVWRLTGDDGGNSFLPL